MKSQKLIVQVYRILAERSKKSLEIAKEEILQEKRASKEVNNAFKYYTKRWSDVAHPGLVSIACEAVGGRADDTIPVQVATLLLTAGFDLHDDIIDGSKMKYGKPTVFAKFGGDITLLAGDAFLMKALSFLRKLRKQFPAKKIDAIWDIIDNLFFELGDAEALEVSQKGNIGISANEAFQILKMKASTFEAHTRIGAIVGGAEKNVVDLLGNYGRTLGILVSIREDFIDIFEAKELHNRFRNEILPLPILYAFNNPQTKNIIINYLSKQRISDKDAEKIVEIVFENENVEAFRNEVKRLAEKAIAAIKNTPNKVVIPFAEKLIRGIIEDL